MLTKYKIKKYLNTKETFTLYEELLSFYTSIYMKEVFRFWGLKHIQLSVDWENQLPAALILKSEINSHFYYWKFTPEHCTYEIAEKGTEAAAQTLSYEGFETVNDLFETMRSLLPE